VRLALDPFGDVTLRRDGAALVTESRLAVSFPRPPLHVHPGQSESFEVREGRLRLTVDGDDLVLAPGDRHTVHAGTPHTFAVEGAEPVRLLATFHPAGQLERFFAGLHRLAERGHIDARGRPRSLAVAPFALAHLDEFRLARVPAWLQAAALTALVRVSRHPRAG
jgi:mannose-6-phosphate isomerase-like protein (cupin superfamily)